MARLMTKVIKIFYSYAEEDKALLNELDRHLTSLWREGSECWDKRKILPGVEKAGEIHTQLKLAHIILLLISPNYLASSDCYDVEMQCALERHRTDKTYVIPIILAPVDLQGTPLAGLQPLPWNATPISEWSSPDKAFADVLQGVRRVIDSLTQKTLGDNQNLSKQAISETFITQTQQFETLAHPTILPTTPTKLDFRRKLVTAYDLDIPMATFKKPLDYGKAFRFAIAGDGSILRQYVFERMLQEFKGQIRGEYFTTHLDLNQQDLLCPLASLLETKIKRLFNYKQAGELVTKHAREHVILTVWNYDLPQLKVQEALSAFWQSFIPAISRHLDRKKLCFVLILAHLPPEDQPCVTMDGITYLPLPDFDVQGELYPWLSRKFQELNIPDRARNYCLNQLQDLYPNPVQILRRMEYIASYLQGEYDEGRFIEAKIRHKRRVLQK